MRSPQALIMGLPARSLPPASADSQNTDISARFGRYGESAVLSYVRKTHLLADEGAYFTTNNAQTAITAPAAVAFVATTPALVVVNTDSASNTSAKRIYIDYLYLLAGATAYSNGTSNTGMFWSMVIDNGNRYTSGGTNLTAAIVNANMDLNNSDSVALIYFGAITATAATGAARAIVGQRLFREPVSATVLSNANMDDWYYNFGGVEGVPANSPGSSGVLQANISHKMFNCPPIVIGPGQSFLLYIWQISNSAPVAGTLIPELGVFER